MKHNKTPLIFPYDFNPTLISYLKIIHKICEFSGDINPNDNKTDINEENNKKNNLIRDDDNSNNNNNENISNIQPLFDIINKIPKLDHLGIVVPDRGIQIQIKGEIIL